MERQNRLLTILTLILLALIALLYLGRDSTHKPLGDDDAPPRHDLFDYENDQVRKITLHRGATELVFEKSDGTWAMTAPRAMTVDQQKVTEIVERFGTLEVEERTIDGKLEELGLDEASRAELTLANNDGKTWTVRLGKDAAVGYATYLQERADGPIQLASSKVAELVERSADDFRSREVWKVSSGTARRIRFEAGGASVVLRKDDHGWWLGDNGPRADKEKVDTWLTKAQGLRVEAFLDDRPAAAAGLEPPAAKVAVETDEGTAELMLGPTLEGGVDALVAGQVVHLGEEGASLVSLAGWEATRLMVVRRYQIDRVEVQLGAKHGVLTRTEGEWRTLDGVATILGDPLLQRIEDAQASWSEPGLPAPKEAWGRILLTEGDTRREAVTIGELLPDGRRVARDEAGGPPFAIAVEELEKISAGLP